MICGKLHLDRTINVRPHEKCHLGTPTIDTTKHQSAKVAVIEVGPTHNFTDY